MSQTNVPVSTPFGVAATTVNTNASVLTPEQTEVIAKLTHKMLVLGAPAKPQMPVVVGPRVVIYRFAPSGATRIASIEGLAKDFALELAAESVLVKRFPGDDFVSVIVPRSDAKPLSFLETTSDLWRARDTQAVPLNLGITQLGEPLVDDLSEAPHMLIAGSTGTGKTTWLLTVITSIALAKGSDEVKLALSDTKGVEFSVFNGLPHLWCRTSFEVSTTIPILEELLEEMERRYTRMRSAGVRKIQEYNQKYHPKMPYIVFVADELADIMEYKQKVERGSDEPRYPGEAAVTKLAQKARSAGIHLLVATQRPSVDIVSGTIKANFLARAAFRLPSGTDSRTVLDTTGAEHLLGKGDMLYLSPHRAGLTRCHAPYTRDEDITAAIDSIRRRVTP